MSSTFLTPRAMNVHRPIYNRTSILPNKWCIISVIWNQQETYSIEWSIDLNTPQTKSPQFAVTKRKSAMVHSRDAKAKYFGSNRLEKTRHLLIS
jgi:hypothetical protein